MEVGVRSKWDRRFYKLAEHVAQWSKDPDTRVGAVLVGKDRRDVAVGYNGFPPGILDSDERLRDRELKRLLTQHAERNVLDNARFPADGGVLYVTFFPCSQCAKSIVSKRVSRVVCPLPSDREPWASDSSLSRMIMSEAGVEVTVAGEAGSQVDETWDCDVDVE